MTPNPRSITAAVTLGACLFLSGCGSGEKSDKPSNVNAGLDALASGTDAPPTAPESGTKPNESELAALARKAAIDLQAVLDQEKSGTSPSNSSTQSESTQPDSSTGAGLSTLAADQGSTPAANTPATATPSTEVPSSAPAGPASASKDLVASLRDRILTSNKPFDAALSLAALAAVEPAAAAELDDPASPIRRVLSPTELRTLASVRQTLKNVTASPDSAAAGSATAAQTGFRIVRAALCSSVSGFGQYRAFKDTTFTAGRPIRAVLYIELDGFDHKPQPDGDDGSPRWSVDVSRELSLYASGLLVWHRPAAAVQEISLNKRRDFYLVEEITLPPTLGVGKYDLKISVRDQSVGTTPLAEALVPLRLVTETIEPK
jgi:hypothetical protein